MSKAAHDESRALIDRHFGGRIDRAMERRMRAHLLECDACRAYYDRHLLFAELDPRALDKKTRLGRGLGFGARQSIATGALLTASAIAATALLLLVVVKDDFTERGGNAEQNEIVVYRLEQGQPPALARDVIDADDELAFAVRNPAGKQRVMVFAVDEHNHVYWYHPAWLDASTEPRAPTAPRSADLVELPGAVSHAFDGRELLVYALFTDEALSVRDVERALASGHQLATKGLLVVRSYRVDGAR